MIGYYRYVDDMLIIHDKSTQNNITLKDFNSVHKKLKFTMKLEKERKLSFLDTTVTNTANKFEFDIYRKTATTDHIHQSLCHPTEHKLAGIKYFRNHMETYPISNNKKTKRKALHSYNIK
jgi:hypothetical protein